MGKHYIDEWVSRVRPKPASIRFIKVVIHRLNDTLRETSFIRHHVSETLSCPDCFAKQADLYFDYMRLRGVKESTIQQRKRYCFDLLEFLASSGLYALNEINPRHIYDAFSQSNLKANFSTTVSSFLKFIYKHGYHSVDLSGFVPKTRRPQPLPSVFTIFLALLTFVKAKPFFPSLIKFSIFPLPQ